MNIKQYFKKNKAKYKNSFKREYKDINYKEMCEILKNKNAILIDVRSKQEYAENHFNGAINIPLDEINKKIKSKISDKEQIIILYCQHGSRSKKAQKILQKLGYKNVYNLKEGIEG